MRYKVIARLKDQKRMDLKRAIENETLGKGSAAGGEYLRNMRSARVMDDNTVVWVEVCFCTPPLAEERIYWEEFFELLSIDDALERMMCKHETKVSLWSCMGCDCAHPVESFIASLGRSFLAYL